MTGHDQIVAEYRQAAGDAWRDWNGNLRKIPEAARKRPWRTDGNDASLPRQFRVVSRGHRTRDMPRDTPTVALVADTRDDLADVDYQYPVEIPGLLVVLSETIQRYLWAPPGMDPSNVSAWLKLLRLPNTARSRVRLAILTSRFSLAESSFVDRLSDGSDRSWQSVSRMERRVALQMYSYDMDYPRQRVALSGMRFVDEDQSNLHCGDGTMIILIDLISAIRNAPWLGSRVSKFSSAVVDHAGNTVVRIAVPGYYDDKFPDPAIAELFASEPMRQDSVACPSNGFAPPPVARSVPLDVSLTAAAHAASRRSTTEYVGQSDGSQMP